MPAFHPRPFPILPVLSIGGPPRNKLGRPAALYNQAMPTVIIDLPDQLDEQLRVFAAHHEVAREDAVTDILRRHLLIDVLRQAYPAFESAAKAAGWESEEDVLRDVS